MSTEQIILGGGCFWCVEPVFSSIKGVVEVVPGYCGGHINNPSYHQVCTQNTGHVEVVRVSFNASKIGLKQLLEVFFATHDPTTLNRQGADVGPQYASVIFYTKMEQIATINNVLNEVKNLLSDPVVTRVEEAKTFWVAEHEHHEYYLNNPYQGYCQVVIEPKLMEFRKRFANLIKA